MIEVLQQLRTAFVNSGLSYQQVSDSSGISKSTISRIMTGATDNPSLQNSVDIALALGHDLILVRSGEEPPVNESSYSRALRYRDERIATLTESVAHKDQQLEDKDAERRAKDAEYLALSAELRHKNRWIHILSMILVVVVMSLIYLFIDANFGHWGIIRY